MLEIMTFSLTAKNCQFILEIWPFNHFFMKWNFYSIWTVCFTWNTIQRCNEQARPNSYEYVAIFCEMEMFKVAALITLLNWLHFVANEKKWIWIFSNVLWTVKNSCNISHCALVSVGYKTSSWINNLNLISRKVASRSARLD